MKAENLIRAGDQPVDEGGFFQVDEAVNASSNPIARHKHVARNLRLRGVDVVHLRRGGNNATEVDGCCKGENAKIGEVRGGRDPARRARRA